MCVHKGSEGCVFRCVGMKLTKYSLLLQETQTNPCSPARLFAVTPATLAILLFIHYL